MASEQFKTVKATGVTNSDTTLFTVPSGHVYLVRQMIIVETAGNAEAYNIWWTDSSDSDAVVYLEKSSALAANADAGYQRLFALEAGDTLKCSLDSAGDVDFTVTFVDQTL